MYLHVFLKNLFKNCSLGERNLWSTLMTIHSTPISPILVVSISDDLTNVRLHCVCCRDYVRRELDAVTSSGVSSTVSKVMHDSDFNLIQVGRAIQAFQNV